MPLKGISPVISPDLLKVLAEMGHGDEIVLADAHFPSHSICPPNIPVLRADVAEPQSTGITVSRLLAGISPLLELDNYGVVPVLMMEVVKGDTFDASVESDFRSALKYDGEIEKLERFAFYERAKKAFAIVATGETRKYGNIILKKGVTPIQE
ncbi:putative RbsD/FucU transporter [Colletotrichum sublineola]|uniref:L-fucose mutarotase n=1 Tax=Colletotrichum sublineola TaxID=1173701 RepID=A0A066XNB5_COLSU|nr:putative RbsD/FucU transporter [Colletotrichum sublineola]